jgi:hypothetical protein
VSASNINLDIVNGQMLLQALVDSKLQTIPSSYRYINVLYKGVATGTASYDTLQQAIYIGLIPNTTQRINLTRNLTPKSTQSLIKKLLNTSLQLQGKGLLHQSDLTTVVNALSDKDTSSTIIQVGGTSQELVDIFQDAYTKLRTNFIDSDTITDAQLIQ